MFISDNLPELTHKQFLKIDHDPEQSAQCAALVYVKDSVPGIIRLRRGKGFSYRYNKKTIKDSDELTRIRKLAIPPAWKNVWICSQLNGHIQATGIDLLKRKQYRYHALWNSIRQVTKFHRLYAFGKVLAQLRAQLDKDISVKELTEQKVIATVVALMERTYIRVGNHDYEKLYGSYGLTTLKDKHVRIKDGEMKFSFKGKKGVYHNISLKDRRLARIVKECRDIPGQELFQYYDHDGKRKTIDSGSVNSYIKRVTGGDFSAKDFRLWAGSLSILGAFQTLGEHENKTECKQKVNRALEMVSTKLGNTRSVCRSYYVHPGIINLYEEKAIKNYLKEMDVKGKGEKNGLNHEETILMKILKKLAFEKNMQTPA